MAATSSPVMHGSVNQLQRLTKSAPQCTKLPKCFVLLQGYSCPQFITCMFVYLSDSSEQLAPAYIDYIWQLNRDNSLPATALKLAQCWLCYSLVWKIVKLLRLHVLLTWLWSRLVWPVVLGLTWRPSLVIAVRQSFMCIVSNI
jgi:hypothetical protein